jgi:hypothetical protein
MALIMKYIDRMHHYFDKYGGNLNLNRSKHFNLNCNFLDPRTKDFPLMSSPLHTLGICMGYVYFVKVLGPRFMENRKPFQLKSILIFYNLFQVLFSAWLFYEVSSTPFIALQVLNSYLSLQIGISGWLTGHYNFRCQPVEYNNSPRTLRVSWCTQQEVSILNSAYFQMVHACWWYYFSKFTEFLDTVSWNEHFSTFQLLINHFSALFRPSQKN